MVLHESLVAVRGHPGIYIGGPPPWARRHALLELLSNAFDEWLTGRARNIRAEEPDERTLVVEDDGGGIATATLRKALSALHDRATLDGHRPHVHLYGRAGLGLAAISALSETFDVDTSDGHVRTRWSLARGEPCGEPVTTPAEGSSGTRIRAVIDASLWPGDHAPSEPPPSFDHEAERLADLAPGLAVGSGDRWFTSEGLVPRARRLGASTARPLIERTVTEDGCRYRVVLGWRADGGPAVEELAGNYRPAAMVRGANWLQTALQAYARSVGLGPAWRITEGRIALCAIEDAHMQWGTPTGDVIVDPAHRRRVGRIVRDALDALCGPAPADVLAFTRVAAR